MVGRGDVKVLLQGRLFEMLGCGLGYCRVFGS